jgi:hypothetical protein
VPILPHNLWKTPALSNWVYVPCEAQQALRNRTVFREAAKFYYILLSKTFCYSSTFIMENMKAWMKANCHPDHFRGVFQEAVANNQMKTAIYGSLLAVVIVWALVTKWTRSRKSPASRPSTPDIEKPKVSLLEGRGARVDRKWGGILDTHPLDLPFC